MEKRVWQMGGGWKNGIEVCHVKTDVRVSELSLLNWLLKDELIYGSDV